jgi:hypothetical protein
MLRSGRNPGKEGDDIDQKIDHRAPACSNLFGAFPRLNCGLAASLEQNLQATSGRTWNFPLVPAKEASQRAAKMQWVPACAGTSGACRRQPARPDRFLPGRD